MRGIVPAWLDDAAAGRPRVQVAADGRWERAQPASLPLTPKDAGELLDAAASADPALEVLWPGPPVVFVGTRTGLTRSQRMHQIAARADWVPSQVIELLAGGAPGPAVRAELGAVNAWRSIAPLPLRIDADPAAVQRALEGRSDLLDSEHPVALEVVHDQPCEVWWAIEVFRSTIGAGESRTDQVAAAVHRLLDGINVINGRARRA